VVDSQLGNITSVAPAYHSLTCVWSYSTACQAGFSNRVKKRYNIHMHISCNY